MQNLETEMAKARITVFAGHYGSGKTSLAVAYALQVKKMHSKVAVADLDIVNPYFRTKDSQDLLCQQGIRLISSEYANTNLEAPSLPPEAAALFDDQDLYGIIDVGGDDRGAYAIGRYSKRLEAEPSVSILLVVNCYRALTRQASDVLAIREEIEQAAHIRFTGFVNNSNLGAMTTKETVLQSIPYAETVATLTKLPLIFTSVCEELLPELAGEIPNLFGVSIPDKNKWRI